MEQALSGFRITDLTIITAGACATQLLADLGAEVIKIEAGVYPDPFRYWTQAPDDDGSLPDPWNWSPSFNMVNRNKRGVCLDLKHPRGREVFLELVKVSDAVTENFRRGAMERLGLSYEDLRKVNPNIVMLSLASQGSTGPENRYTSYGSTLDALSGLMGITGYQGSHPLWSSGDVNYPDQVAAVFGAGILMAALRYRERTGKGTYIDLSQRELITTMIGEQVLGYTAGGIEPQLMGNARPGLAPNDAYRCAGKNDWVTISIADNAEWARLCQVIGRSDLADDERFASEQARQSHLTEIRDVIEAWTSQRDKYSAMEELHEAGIPAGAVQNGAEMLADENLNARGYYQPVENTRAGRQTLRVAPYQLTGTPPVIREPAPLLGEDTESVLREVLDMSDAEIAELAEIGVTNTAAPRGRRAAH